MAIIQPLKKNSQPSRLIFLDCETLPERVTGVYGVEMHSLRLGVAVAGRWRNGQLRSRKECVFTSTDTFLIWLEAQLRTNETTWLIAHNAAFDLQVCGLLSQLKLGRFQLADLADPTASDDPQSIWAECIGKAFIISDPPTILRLVGPRNEKLLCVDSLNWVKMPLAELGEQIGFPKLPMPAFEESDEVWTDYCRRDVEVLLEWVTGFLRFVRDRDLGPIKPTASSQAMAAYRYGYLEHEIRSHTIESVRKLEREGYFGGEFRVLQVGRWEEPVVQIDANSLFPSVMRSHLMPASLRRWHWDNEWHLMPPGFDPSASVAEVWIHSEEQDYPVRLGSNPYYVRGFFPTVLCGPELTEAIHRGHAIAYRRWATYNMAPIFEEYVEAMYALRMQARGEDRRDIESFAKLLLNCLYGKFGQLGTDLVFRPEKSAPIEYGEWIECRLADSESKHYKVVGGDVFEAVARKELRGSCPVISAWITSLARQRMRQVRELLPEEDVFYQGVDSLLMRRRSLAILEAAGLIDPVAIGKFKVAAEADAAAIFGHGYYEIGRRLVLPGRKQTAELDGNRGYHQLTFSGMKSHAFGAPDDLVWSQRRYFRTPQDNLRGQPDDNGFVKPLEVWECPDDYGCDLFRHI